MISNWKDIPTGNIVILIDGTRHIKGNDNAMFSLHDLTSSILRGTFTECSYTHYRIDEESIADLERKINYTEFRIQVIKRLLKTKE